MTASNQRKTAKSICISKCKPVVLKRRLNSKKVLTENQYHKPLDYPVGFTIHNTENRKKLLIFRINFKP